MTLYLGRDAYATSGESFAGLPATVLAGDVGPTDPVVFSATIKESNLSDLRHALTDVQGFHGHLLYTVAGDNFAFKFLYAHLTTELAPRDWNTNTVHAVWNVERRNLTECVRPRGQVATDYSDTWNTELYSYGQAVDHLRRKRLELVAYVAEGDARSVMLADADRALAERRTALWASGTDDLRASAEARGL